MTAAPWPDHLLTVAEWDALPQDTSRCYELVAGVLLVVPRPAPLHQRAMLQLCHQIDPQLPAELTVLPDVEVLVRAGEPRPCGLPTSSSSARTAWSRIPPARESPAP